MGDEIVNFFYVYVRSGMINLVMEVWWFDDIVVNDVDGFYFSICDILGCWIVEIIGVDNEDFGIYKLKLSCCVLVLVYGRVLF